MLKSKKFNGSLIGIVVLSVLLVMAIAVGSTLAWFASQDSASTDFVMGDAVLLTLANEAGSLEDDAELDFVIPAEKLVPGMQIFPTVYADVVASTTSALLRAKVTVTASIEGETIDGAVKTKIETEMMKQFIMKTNGWYYDEPTAAIGIEGEEGYVPAYPGYFYFVGNGDNYSKYMTKVGDFSNTNDVKYATYTKAGSLIDAEEFNLLNASTEPALTKAEVQNNYLRNTSFINKNIVEGTVTAAQVDKDLHTVGSDKVMASVVTNAVMEDGTPASEFTGDVAHVPFLVRPIIVPIGWANESANVQIDIKIEFEAVQDYLVALDSEYQDVIAVLLPTIATVRAIFDDAAINSGHVILVPAP